MDVLGIRVQCIEVSTRLGQRIATLTWSPINIRHVDQREPETETQRVKALFRTGCVVGSVVPWGHGCSLLAWRDPTTTLKILTRKNEKRNRKKMFEVGGLGGVGTK